MLTKRQKLNPVEIQENLAAEAPGTIESRCRSDRPVLVGLEVIGVEPGARPHWVVVNAIHAITIRAITDPPDLPVEWTNVTTPQGNLAELSRSQVLDRHIVTATLGEMRETVELNVVDLVDIARENEVFDGPGGVWKTHEWHAAARLSAVTVPARSFVWNKLTWSDDTQGTRDQHAQLDRSWPAHKADNSAVEVRQATVTLGTLQPIVKTRPIRICRWPVLRLDEVQFTDSHAVVNDGVAEIGQRFDGYWKRTGRQAPAANVPTSDCQTIVCRPRGTTLRIRAKFKVTRLPTDPERVTLRAGTTVGGVRLAWTGPVDIAPHSDEAVFPDTDSDQPFANQVAAESALAIDWTLDAPANRRGAAQDDAPAAVGTSSNLLYVTLGQPAPNTDMYWTLLALSCDGGNGTSTENNFVPAAFGSMATTVGDGNGVQRKGDGIRLSYYLDGTNTRATADVYGTQGILSSLDGTGRCGGWANLLIHMFNMHGVVSANLYAMWRRTSSGACDPYRRFLVKNCSFPGQDPNTRPYHCFGDALIKTDGLPGQGKTNPQFDFADHVTVRHNGQIYDPSYGVGPFATAAEYEANAIAGYGILVSGKQLTLPDGTVQAVSDFVSPHPYKYGIYQSGAGETLESIRQGFQNSPLVFYRWNWHLATAPLVMGTRVKVVVQEAIVSPQLNWI